MPRKLSTTLWLVLAKVFFISELLAFFVVRIVESGVSPGIEREQVFESIAGFIWILGLVLCSLTVFFNLFKKVRDNLILRFLSFFLLPLLAIGLFRFSQGTDGDWAGFYIDIGSFLVTHLFFYIQFNLHLRNNDKDGKKTNRFSLKWKNTE